MTLRGVEKASARQFKATSVAGYERGERSITVERFVSLCQLYGAPAGRLIDDILRAYAGELEPEIDLTALESLPSSESELLTGFIREINALRGERAAGTVMLRVGDIAVLATASGRQPEELLEALRPAIPSEQQ